jgi:hypothetical protein
MTSRTLTGLLVKRVMKWGVGPDRFLLGGRRWMPETRFKPVDRIEDAFQLLEAASPQEYAMGRDRKGTFWVRVRLDGGTGEARSTRNSTAICQALARALRIEIESFDS